MFFGSGYSEDKVYLFDSLEIVCVCVCEREREGVFLIIVLFLYFSLNKDSFLSQSLRNYFFFLLPIQYLITWDYFTISLFTKACSFTYFTH